VNTGVGLVIIGRFGEASEPKESIIYSVTGLSPGDHCVIGYAGLALDGKKKWHLQWYKNAEKIPTPDTLFDSPEHALNAVAEVIAGR
jgi:hypothetical protein